jgi:hypothetical protein
LDGARNGRCRADGHTARGPCRDLDGIEILRAVDGRIVERWGEFNGVEMVHSSARCRRPTGAEASVQHSDSRCQGGPQAGSDEHRGLDAIDFNDRIGRQARATGEDAS